MFWVWIAGLMIVVIGMSVAVGAVLQRPRGRQLSRQDKLTMAKASGAFPHRKES